MLPQRWHLVERLYHQARAMPAEMRSAFVAEACGQDAAFARERLSLLAEPGSAPGVFEDAAPMALGSVA